MPSQPLPILGTIKDAYAFVNGNKQAFMKVFLPIFPALAVIEPFLLFTDQRFAAADPGRFMIVTAAALAVLTPFWAAFACGWHRAVIYGPENVTPVNPLRLGKNEWQYGGLFFLIVLFFNFGVFALLPLAKLLTPFLPPETVRILMLTAGMLTSAILICLALRAAFWFPAKAVGSGVTLREAFVLSRGLVLQLFVALLAAAVPIKLITFIYYLVAGTLHAHLFGGELETTASKVTFYILALPTLFLDYILAAIILTVLTRYYLWAVQNRSV